MDIRVIHGNIAEQETDCIVVNLFEGVTEPGGGTNAVDRSLDGAIRRLIASTSTLEAAAKILEVDPATLYRKRKRV